MKVRVVWVRLDTPGPEAVDDPGAEVGGVDSVSGRANVAICRAFRVASAAVGRHDVAADRGRAARDGAALGGVRAAEEGTAHAGNLARLRQKSYVVRVPDAGAPGRDGGEVGSSVRAPRRALYGDTARSAATASATSTAAAAAE